MEELLLNNGRKMPTFLGNKLAGDGTASSLKEVACGIVFGLVPSLLFPLCLRPFVKPTVRSFLQINSSACSQIRSASVARCFI